MYSFCGICYPAVGTTLKGGPMEPELEDPVEGFCKEVDGNKGGSGDAKRKAGFFICRRPFHSNPKSHGTCGTMEMFLKASLTMLPFWLSQDGFLARIR
jgi:hypothetical protein